MRGYMATLRRITRHLEASLDVSSRILNRNHRPCVLIVEAVNHIGRDRCELLQDATKDCVDDVKLVDGQHITWGGLVTEAVEVGIRVPVQPRLQSAGRVDTVPLVEVTQKDSGPGLNLQDMEDLDLVGPVPLEAESLVRALK